MLNLIGRKEELFNNDVSSNEKKISDIIKKSSFLVLGAAGSIGQSVTKEIFKRHPKKLHAIDISENNLVELVRDIRSSYGYILGVFKTYALDIGSLEYDAFIKSDGKYDYVLNLSALKHVRSEKDPFTLMRMIDVNIFNTNKTIEQSILNKTKKYFCVSTDKAANPVNMMGASKKIMEMFIMKNSDNISISTARFANVAFSDGSLLYSFNQRLIKNQPLVAPNDVKRYFVTQKESGKLCLMSCLLGDNRDIFFPKLDEKLHLISFADIAVKFLNDKGFEPYLCNDEDEAREKINELILQKKWPCLFSSSDTTGEKDFEEFFTEKENLDLNRFNSIGVIKNKLPTKFKCLISFTDSIQELKRNLNWSKKEILNIFEEILGDTFQHLEKDKYLDEKM